jgi:hypothetical protein
MASRKSLALLASRSLRLAKVNRLVCGFDLKPISRAQRNPNFTECGPMSRVTF